MLRCVSLAALAWACALPAAAQMARHFPGSALRGEVVVTQPPEILLNRQPARLAPGARIRDTQNLLQLSGALAGQRLVVHYTLDLNRQLLDVWVLTPEERAHRPWPRTPAEAAAWQFNPDTQTWTIP
jgi:hypothetical protein